MTAVSVIIHQQSGNISRLGLVVSDNYNSRAFEEVKNVMEIKLALE